MKYARARASTRASEGTPAGGLSPSCTRSAMCDLEGLNNCNVLRYIPLRNFVLIRINQKTSIVKFRTSKITGT